MKVFLFLTAKTDLVSGKRQALPYHIYDKANPKSIGSAQNIFVCRFEWKLFDFDRFDLEGRKGQRDLSRAKRLKLILKKVGQDQIALGGVQNDA